MDDRQLLEASIARMKNLSFGDPVTNVCAGDKNPMLHSFFVAYKVDSRTNRYGVVHRSHWAKCTDKNGRFWDIGIDVIHPGHLSSEDRARLFEPVWQARYGDKAAAEIGRNKEHGDGGGV